MTRRPPKPHGRTVIAKWCCSCSELLPASAFRDGWRCRECVNHRNRVEAAAARRDRRVAKGWTDAELASLRATMRLPAKAAAAIVGRTPHAVYGMRYALSKGTRSRAAARAWQVPRGHADWLIARTCDGCHRFLLAADFPLQAPRGTSWRGWKCWPCVSRASNEYERAANQRTRPSAQRNGMQWTGPELELLGRREISNDQLAAMLGRTRWAVREQRNKLGRGEPRQVYLAGLAAR